MIAGTCSNCLYASRHPPAPRHRHSHQLPWNSLHTPCRPEVCIFFNDRLMRGNRCSKIDSASIAAFESQNFAPLAVIGTSLSVSEALVLPAPKGSLNLMQTKALSVAPRKHHLLHLSRALTPPTTHINSHKIITLIQAASVCTAISKRAFLCCGWFLGSPTWTHLSAATSRAWF